MSGKRSVLVIDNGGYTLKALYVADTSNITAQPPRQVVIPNCVGAASFAGRGIVGEQLFKLPHFHGFMLRRPIDRGFVVDVALQSYIWEYLLQLFAIADESDVELILTVPFAAPKQVGELLHYLVVQRFKFRAVTLLSATFLALMAVASREWLHGCAGDCDNGNAMVLDFGFSATTVVPYVDFRPVRDAALRIDVGGKLLANRLKELISFTQVNMAEDGWLVNHIMERCCYVELHPLAALRAAECEKRQRVRNNSSSGVRYFLPTVPSLMPLGCREEELYHALGSDAVAQDRHALQHIVFRHEAFLIPELLFRPADVGIRQMGVVEAVLHGTRRRGALREMPTLHQALLCRIVAFGGTARFPQLRERLTLDLREELIDGICTQHTLASSNDTAPLQQLVERHKITQATIHIDDSNTQCTPEDTELQPLYGALALLICPHRRAQLQVVQQRSHVDLSSLRALKPGLGRAQTLTSQKILNSIQDALLHLL